MPSNGNEGLQRIGCAMSIIALCVTTPMWLALMFALMQANEMPQWSWVLYWCYVPIRLIAHLVMGLARTLMEAE